MSAATEPYGWASHHAKFMNRLGELRLCEYKQRVSHLTRLLAQHGCDEFRRAIHDAAYFGDQRDVAENDVESERAALIALGKHFDVVFRDCTVPGLPPDPELTGDQRKELDELRSRAIQAARDRLAFLDPSRAAPTATPTVIHHGERSYSHAGNRPIIVSNEQHNALRAFAAAKAALDTKALENSGVSNVSRVMADLARKFPGAVQFPEGKGTGYYVAVETIPPTPPANEVRTA